MVIQEGERARAFHVDLSDWDFSVGDSLVLEGFTGSLVTVLPDFPNRPANVERLPNFETATNSGNYFLARVRGYLVPQITGEYTFWIASDDSSELWLSEDASHTNIKKIAAVPTGRFASPRAWDKHESQKSSPIFLQGGRKYYIEALHQDNGGFNSLAVAWQGPGIPRSVIESRYLVPFGASKGNGLDVADDFKGVVRESWTNFVSADLSALKRTNEFVLNLCEARVVSRSVGRMPEPLRIRPGQAFREEENFRRVEAQGYLSFQSKSDHGVELELAEWPSNIRVRIPAASANSVMFPKNALIRVRGVCEATREADNTLKVSVIWANDVSDLSWVESEDNWSQYKSTPGYLFTMANTELRPNQLVRVRGTVVRKESEGRWRIQEEDTFRGYTSQDGSNWVEISPPIEFAAGNTVLAGFAVASPNIEGTTVAEFTGISGLGKFLEKAQIGETKLPGSFSLKGSNCRIEGGGYNVWGTSDQCYFAFQKMDGEGEIVARLTDLKTSHDLGKAVVMIRESLEAPSTWAGVVRMPGRVGFQARRETGGKVAGGFLAESGEWIKLTRSRHSLLIRLAGGQQVQPGQMLDILGNLGWEKENIVLADSRVRQIVQKKTAPTDISGDVRPLTDELLDVRIKDLVAEDEKAELEARVATRFRIRGVVTFNDQVAGMPLLFVHDDTGGCLVRLWTYMPRDSFKVGKVVELTGDVAVRGLMPEFSAWGCSVLGDARMPQPEKYPFEAPLAQRRRGLWMEIEGVGRALRSNNELLVMTREGLLSVVAGKELAAHLGNCVGSLVRFRGVFWRGLKPMLLVPSASFVEVEEASPTDPFAIPLSSIASLSKIDSERWSLPRRKFQGTVTCKRDDMIVVQDDSGGATVALGSSGDIRIGDGVEVAGFLTEPTSGVAVSDAIIRKLARRELPLPLNLSSLEGLYPGKNNLTVSLEAVLLQKIMQGGVQWLDLQAGQRAFRAYLPVNDGLLPSIANGSKVRVTGVSQIESAEPNEEGTGAEPILSTLHLLLRTPRDIVVLRNPPWWNWRYTVALIGLSISLAVSSLIWIRTLRKRVEHRTGQLREAMGQLQKETQISATLAERDRLAAEIHDSVEQGLSAIIMQMDTAEKLVDQPDEMKRFLKTVRDMAGFSRAEVHHAVWSMQSPLLENADLPAALKRIAHDVSADGSPRVDVEILGVQHKLPAPVEHHVLRVGQEAITNAVKHAHPNTIRVELNYASDNVRLVVRDDGCGFDPRTVTVGISHFGLQGLRKRTKKIRGMLTITSKPGNGATVEIVVPLNNSAKTLDLKPEVSS